MADDNYTKALEKALQTFLTLDWQPDQGPEPTAYIVDIQQAHEALRQAGTILQGRTPFPAEIDGSIMEYKITKKDGNVEINKIIWSGGKAYGKNQRYIQGAASPFRMVRGLHDRNVPYRLARRFRKYIHPLGKGRFGNPSSGEAHPFI